MTHLPDPQIQTLYATARTDAANLARLATYTPTADTEHASDLATLELSKSLEALNKALMAPLDRTGWRRVNLSGGRYAEVFTMGVGAAYALRNAEPEPGEPATVFCRHYPHVDEAQRAFAMTVYLSAAHGH